MFTVQNAIIIACTLIVFWGLKSVASAVRRVADVLYKAIETK